MTPPIAKLTVKSRPERVLDFDTECRPLHWIADDYVSADMTAMAWAWCNDPSFVECYVLGEVDQKEMLMRFVAAYNRADVVTGHFIRGHDLPLINGALSENGLPPLEDKLTHDTKLDLIRRKGMSNSQENLGGMLGLEHPKVHMGQTQWREANRLTAEGLKLTRERVIGDVKQHIEMRRRLLELGYLRPPRLWRSIVR